MPEPLAIALLSFLSLTALATMAPAAAVEPGKVAVELNKLEARNETGCRAYVVVNNADDKAYDTLKLDLVMFQPDGVIGRRFAVELGPVKPNKRSVKLFDLDNLACDKVGSFLVNDVLDCKAGSANIDDCLTRLTVSSLTNVQLTK